MQLAYPAIRLKKGKERSVLLRHPWIFSGAILSEPTSINEGDIVQVLANDGTYLATGHFHKGTITVRCFDFNEVPVDDNFFRGKIRAALELRKALHLPSDSTNCYRLIHGEGDGMPGLIADVYGNTLVMQTYTLGMHKFKPALCQIILEEIPDIEAIYDKSIETMSKHGTTIEADHFLFQKQGYAPYDFVVENGLKYSIDFINGQKTGFFLDQRDNRFLLRQYSKDKNVLNTFCYTGGFSISALAGGAQSVDSIDSSKRALVSLEDNLKLNELSDNHTSYGEDVMSYLKKCEKQYNVIVLDPPAYAKHLNQVSNAMVGYRNLNTEGLKRIEKGGILFTFSCSQAVDKELFRKLVFQSAIQAKREVKILHQLSQPADHPVSIFHPEAEYLKGLVLFVN